MWRYLGPGQSLRGCTHASACAKQLSVAWQADSSQPASTACAALIRLGNCMSDASCVADPSAHAAVIAHHACLRRHHHQCRGLQGVGAAEARSGAQPCSLAGLPPLSQAVGRLHCGWGCLHMASALWPAQHHKLNQGARLCSAPAVHRRAPLALTLQAALCGHCHNAPPHATIPMQQPTQQPSHRQP